MSEPKPFPRRIASSEPPELSTAQRRILTHIQHKATTLAALTSQLSSSSSTITNAARMLVARDLAYWDRGPRKGVRLAITRNGVDRLKHSKAG